MKIAFSGDNHLFYYAKDIQARLVKDMIIDIKNENPDIMCYLGDFGEMLLHEDMSLVQELFNIQPTLYVMGNHDLYSQQDLNPIEAMNEALNVLRYGIPLQTSWQDIITSYEKDEVLFLGTIGFPDFTHPKLLYPTQSYNYTFPTIDATYINLQKGWLFYTDLLLKAFKKKLQIIDKRNCKNIVILTHYPIFESQYRLNVNEDISNCFYCHSLGVMISETAKKHLDKQFYCIAAHGHQYNINRWFDITNNIKTFGFVTDYGREDYEILEI